MPAAIREMPGPAGEAVRALVKPVEEEGSVRLMLEAVLANGEGDAHESERPPE